ncbi:MAG: cytochrome c1 [Pseudomonadaceae bacterium]|nr:cytochrome c1 [Pseudomonadaceae bacterium]
MFVLLLGLLFPLAVAAGEGPAIAKQDWGFDGLHGQYDKATVYRGYQVFTQVCMACHSAKYVSHADLDRAGFTPEEIAALAKSMNLTTTDKLVSGLAPADAQEVYGKVPPDLSVITKARAGLADYTYAVLTGYSDDVEALAHAFPNSEVPAGAYFNTAFAGYAIAMPNPLPNADMVTYTDGTPATVPQMAHDVTVFLQWAAEPELIERKHLGVYVLLFLAIFTLLAYLTKKAIWRDVH